MENNLYYPDSKVEVRGLEAKLYDKGLDILTFGTYPFFIKHAIRSMNIKPFDRILDMGAGTGRNACIMRHFLSKKGEIVGWEIGKEMIEGFKKKCRHAANVRLEKKRIDVLQPVDKLFDKVFISFVIHGFPHNVREIIVKNAWQQLKNGGELFILDYSEFELERMFPPLRFVFKRAECSYAFDFLKRDFSAFLKEHGFTEVSSKLFYRGYIRLLKAIKHK